MLGSVLLKAVNDPHVPPATQVSAQPNALRRDRVPG